MITSVVEQVLNRGRRRKDGRAENSDSRDSYLAPKGPLITANICLSWFKILGSIAARLIEHSLIVEIFGKRA